MHLFHLKNGDCHACPTTALATIIHLGLQSRIGLCEYPHPHTHNVESKAVDTFDFADLMGSSFYVPLCYMESAATDSIEGTIRLFLDETLLTETANRSGQ